MTVTVTMLDNRMGEDGTLWEAGSTHAASEGFAKQLVQYKWASATFRDVTGKTGATARVTAAGRYQLLDQNGAVWLSSSAAATVSRRSSSSVSKMIGLTTASQSGAGNTTCTKMESEAPFSRVRLHIYNAAETEVTGVKAAVAATETAASSTTALVYQPHVGGTQYAAERASDGAPGWALVTFNDAGSTTIPARASEWEFGVLTSDWINLRSVDRADGGTLPLLLHRIYAVEGLTTAGLMTTTWNTASAEAWWRLHRRGTVSGADAVTTLATNGGSEATVGVCVGVEFDYGIPALTVLGEGDSIMEGASQVASRYGNWLWRGAALASTAARPVTALNFAAAGQTAAEYMGAGAAALTLYKPDVLVHQLYSSNDGEPTQALCNVALANLSKVLAAAKLTNTRVLVFTALPKSYLSGPDAFRVSLNETARAMARAGSFDLLDADLLLSNGATPAALQEALRADITHPNDAGHQVLGEALAEYLLSNY